MIDGEVAVRQALPGEVGLDVRAAAMALELVDAICGMYGAFDSVNEKAGLAIHDRLGKRSACNGDHWRAAGHRLDNAEPEWFIEVDESTLR